MDRVLLFFLQTDHVKVTIEAFFDSTGNLIVEGYDIGKSVEEYWGDSDYEYSVTVPAEEVIKVYELFALPKGNQQQLLSWLQAHYNTNTCYSDFRQWLEVNKIKHEGFSWR